MSLAKANDIGTETEYAVKTKRGPKETPRHLYDRLSRYMELVDDLFGNRNELINIITESDPLISLYELFNQQNVAKCLLEMRCYNVKLLNDVLLGPANVDTFIEQLVNSFRDFLNQNIQQLETTNKLIARAFRGGIFLTNQDPTTTLRESIETWLKNSAKPLYDNSLNDNLARQKTKLANTEYPISDEDKEYLNKIIAQIEAEIANPNLKLAFGFERLDKYNADSESCEYQGLSSFDKSLMALQALELSTGSATERAKTPPQEGQTARLPLQEALPAYPIMVAVKNLAKVLEQLVNFNKTNKQMANSLNAYLFVEGVNMEFPVLSSKAIKWLKGKEQCPDELRTELSALKEPLARYMANVNVCFDFIRPHAMDLNSRTEYETRIKEIIELKADLEKLKEEKEEANAKELYIKSLNLRLAILLKTSAKNTAKAPALVNGRLGQLTEIIHCLMQDGNAPHLFASADKVGLGIDNARALQKAFKNMCEQFFGDNTFSNFANLSTLAMQNDLHFASALNNFSAHEHLVNKAPLYIDAVTEKMQQGAGAMVNILQGLINEKVGAVMQGGDEFEMLFKLPTSEQEKIEQLMNEIKSELERIAQEFGFRVALVVIPNEKDINNMPKRYLIRIMMAAEAAVNQQKANGDAVSLTYIEVPPIPQAEQSIPTPAN